MAKNVLVYPDLQQTVPIVLQVTKEKNDPWYQDGFHGMIVNDGASGETVMLDVTQRIWQVNVGGLTAAKGTKIYITTAGVLTNTSSGNRLFGIVSTAKDSNNVADILLAAQS